MACINFPKYGNFLKFLTPIEAKFGNYLLTIWTKHVTLSQNYNFIYRSLSLVFLLLF